MMIYCNIYNSGHYPKHILMHCAVLNTLGPSAGHNSQYFIIFLLIFTDVGIQNYVLWNSVLSY